MTQKQDTQATSHALFKQLSYYDAAVVQSSCHFNNFLTEKSEAARSHKHVLPYCWEQFC